VGANSNAAIRFASNGSIYVAPTATAAPTDVATDLPATWKKLGYVSDAGVSITPSVTTQAINAWQSATPVKYLVTAATFQMAFTLLQFDKEGTELFFGGSFTSNATSEYKLDIDSNPDLVETSMVIEWNDSTVENRLYVPLAQVSGREALTLVRTGATSLGLTFDALDSGGKLGTLFTSASMA